MDAKTKADFILALHKHSLRAFDSGGGISGDISSGVQTVMSPISGVASGLANALTVTNGYNATGPDMTGVVGQQSQLGGLLMNEAQGNGVNPAQEEYLQNAQTAAQQAAALNSSRRAINPALAARMSGNAAVNAQQTAANQSNINREKQMLAAQHEMSGLTGQEMQGAEHAQDINSQVAQNNTNAVNQTEGGILSNVPIIGSLFAKGGPVVAPQKTKFHQMVYAKRMASGGPSSQGSIGKNRLGGSIAMTDGTPGFSNANFLEAAANVGGSGSSGGGGSPDSGLGQFLNGIPTEANNFGATPLSMPGLGSSAGIGAAPGAPSLGVGSLAADAPAAAAMSQGGVPRMVYAAPQSLTKGGKAVAKNKAQRAVVPGDSLKNDKIPALLSQDEEVIDRDTLRDPGPIGKMARVVAAAVNSKKSKADFVRMAQAKRKAGAA